MPAMLEDPTAPVIQRPFIAEDGTHVFPSAFPLPEGIVPKQVTLRDRVSIATIIPYSSPTQVPPPLLAYLSDQFASEIEKGDTYPMLEPLPLEKFGEYWFGMFGAIMLLGDVHDADEVRSMAQQGVDWDKACLGSFYIKPNYPGRSSHVCNGGFLVTDRARNRGVGRLMGETYLEWAPKLGYKYSVFNLVYETNVASCRIWDALGFKRIGRVKGAGNLRSHPGELVDAIIYGRELGQEEDFVSEERFDKIRFYLKTGKYPNGADRAEKSRLRSASVHYKLIPAQGDEAEKLMLKGKEVISDTQGQYEIARQVHQDGHGGINKTTATINERYHWVRIKETVSQVIRNCPECSEMNKHLTNNRALYNSPRFRQEQGQQQQQQQQQKPANQPSPPQEQQQPEHQPPSQIPQTQAPPSTSRRPLRPRPESPSSQLQIEAAQAEQQQQPPPPPPPPHVYASMPMYHSGPPPPHMPPTYAPHPHPHYQQHHNTMHMAMNINSNRNYDAVDPALMNDPTSLDNLPPSPFLTGGQTLHAHNPGAMDMGGPSPGAMGHPHPHPHSHRHMQPMANMTAAGTATVMGAGDDVDAEMVDFEGEEAMEGENGSGVSGRARGRRGTQSTRARPRGRGVGVSVGAGGGKEEIRRRLARAGGRGREV